MHVRVVRKKIWKSAWDDSGGPSYPWRLPILLMMLIPQYISYLSIFDCVTYPPYLLQNLFQSMTDSGNPADDLVDIINLNRTAQKLKELQNNPGLGCMALQYIDACQGNCSSTNPSSCHSPEEDITEVFAPNCGVELPTVDIISGRIIGCQSNYLTPDQVFFSILSRDNKTLSLVRDKKNKELGTAFKKVHHGLFIWSVLFSSGQTNSTFVLEGGTGIKQKGGCFSGNGARCSGANEVWFLDRMSVITYALLTCLAYVTVFR